MIKKKIIKKSNNNWLDSFKDGGPVDPTKPPVKPSLPSDYNQFLEYSKTAPENRRPDSDWEYNNPRQYDHYGMWDALGKPKDFNEALNNNPDWKPDENDGYYHGFSVNPNTGVWLKSHIPGENEPGNTAWMENLSFALMPGKYGPKENSLVYDPEIQRMRYLQKKKLATGGLVEPEDPTKPPVKSNTNPGFDFITEVPKYMYNDLVSYINPYNWGVDRYDDNLSFKSVYKYVPDNSEFIWNGTRYSKNIEKDNLANNHKLVEQKNPEFFAQYKEYLNLFSPKEEKEKRYNDALDLQLRYGNPKINIGKPNTLDDNGDIDRAHYNMYNNEMTIYGTEFGNTEQSPHYIVGDYIEELLHSRQLKDLGKNEYTNKQYYARNKYSNQSDYDKYAYSDPKSLEYVHDAEGDALRGRILRDYNREETPENKEYRAKILAKISSETKEFKPYEQQDKIRIIQKALAEQGYDLSNSTKADGTMDGIWGPESQEAYNLYKNKEPQNKYKLMVTDANKFKNGGWLNNYATGGVTDPPVNPYAQGMNPLMPNTLVSSTTSAPIKQYNLPVKPIKQEEPKEYNNTYTEFNKRLDPIEKDFISIKDTRKIQPVTLKPINPNTDLKTGNYDYGNIQRIIGAAKFVGVPPDLALSISMTENGIGKSDDNFGHVLSNWLPNVDKKINELDEETINKYSYPALQLAYAMQEKIKDFNDLKSIQSYNGTKNLTSNTEKGMEGSGNKNGVKSWYGVDVTKQPLNAGKILPFAKTVKSIQDSVINTNPQIQQLIKNGKLKNGGWLNNYATGGKIDPVKSEYNPLNPQPLEFNSGVPNFDIYSSIKYNPIPNFKDESMDIYGDKDIDLINKSKSDYFNYLDSPQYLETARKTWGNNANKYIDKQKQNIQNTPIVPYKDMKFWDQIKVGGSKAHFDNVRNQILNYWGENPVLIHELSHTTDSKELPKDFWNTDYTDRPGEYVTRTDSINPKYNNPNFIKDAALMSPEYSKWNELFPTDNSNIDHDERPTEIRAYINTIRQQMSSDNFDWNKKSYDEIRKYIELLNNSDNEELKTTIKSLKNKDKEISDLKIKALQDLAINNKNNNVLKVKNGGWLNNYATGGLVDDPTKPFNPINNRDGYFPGMNNQTLVTDATAVKKQVLPTQNELQINKLNNVINNQPKPTVSPMKKEFISEKPSAWEQKMLQKQEEANTLGNRKVTFNQFGEPVLEQGMYGQQGYYGPASGRVDADYMDPLTMAATFGAGAYGKGLNLADAALVGLDWGTYGASSAGKTLGKAGFNALKNSTESGILSKTHTINPWAFKPQEGMMYRGLGKEGFEDAMQSGVFRAKQDVIPEYYSGTRLQLNKSFGINPYFTPKFKTAAGYGSEYLAEVPKSVANWRQRYVKSDWSQVADRAIPIEEGKILQKDWLRGYKQVKTPKTIFNNNIEFKAQPARGNDSYNIVKNNKLIGDFDLEKDGSNWVIGNVGLNKEYRGQGLGKQSFIKANDIVTQKGEGVLHSSGIFSGNDAKNVWNSLVKEGKAEKIGIDNWRFKEVPKTTIDNVDKLNLNSFKDIINNKKINNLTENINYELSTIPKKISPYYQKEASNKLKSGNNWSKEWYNHPETKQRLKTLSEEFNLQDLKNINRDRALTRNSPHNLKYHTQEELNNAFPDISFSEYSKTIGRVNNKWDQILNNINKEPYIGKFQSKDSKLQTILKGEPRVHKDNFGSSGHYLDKDYKGVRQNLIDKYSPNIESTTIHEGNHSFTNGNNWIPQTEQENIVQIFGDNTKVPKRNAEGNFNTLEEYFQNPTEVYARIMELRNYMGVKPGEIVDGHKFFGMMAKGRKGETPVDSKFFDLIKDTPKFKDLFNRLPMVTGAVTATGLALQQNKKQSGGWLNNYK